jgi:transmembrane sensor
MEEKIPETLIVRYLSNEATSEEQLQLFEWMSHDALHQKLFNEYCDLWGKSYKHPISFNTSEAMQRLQHRIAVEQASVEAPTTTVWLKIAASLLILFVTALSVYFLGKYSESSTTPTYTARSTASGQKITLTLTDGSVVRLNANSTLRFPEEFKGMKREVYLQGEAFFEVQKDSLRPFIIHTGDVHTQVLGTSFNIKTSVSQIIVAVATGKVKVTSGARTEFLLPKDKITYWLQDNYWKREKTDLERELAWKSNTIIIENKTLREAADILEKWYGVHISFENNAIKNCRITGKYKNESLENVLKAISYSTETKFTLKQKEVMLYGKGCE